MTTFTMQDLNNINETPTVEEEEAMDALAKLGGGIGLKEMFVAMDPTPQQIVENMAIPLGTNVPPDVTTIINTICAQLQLLSTVISKPQGNSLNAEDQSLQECVGLVLKQADWFKDLVRHELIGAGIEDLAKDAVQEVVENEVEHYFQHQFEPSDHFDFGDAVQDAVSDQIDDVVADRLDDVVQEKFDEFIEGATFKLER